jgi:RNA polymerase sigma-70 factor (ECF subfamily)
VLARLFEVHGRTVYGLCRLLLRDPSDAEDAAQQTFLSAYRALVSGVVPRDPGAWLATIARNECRNRVRLRMREPLALEAAFIGATEPLEETAARSAQIAELKVALLDLPQKQREAVLLRDVYGLRYGEIATAIGATRPAVEALLFRARRRLQGRLRPLRDAAAALLVPVPLRDALAEAVPGFASTGGGAAGAALGLTAAKVATATLLVGTAGTTVAVVGSSERARHVPRPQAAAAVAQPSAPTPELARRAVAAPLPVADVHPDPAVREGARAETRHGRRGSSHERSEERESSSGPGPGVEQEDEVRDEHADRRKGHEQKSEAKSERRHEKSEAKSERRKEKLRTSASHSGRGGGDDDDDEAEDVDADNSGPGGGDDDSVHAG